MSDRMPKRRNRLYRWIAVALTLVLLMGQGNVAVLAEEIPVVNIESSDRFKTITEKYHNSVTFSTDDAGDNASQNTGDSGKQNTGNSDNGNQNTGDNNNGSQNTGNNDNGSQNTGDNDNGSQNTGDNDNGNQNTGDNDNGNQNTGDNDNGSQNAGNSDNGNQNTGDNNNGNQNTGDYDNGNQNTGDSDNGNQNTGDNDNGSQNTGDYDNGNQNAGNGNNDNLSTGDGSDQIPGTDSNDTDNTGAENADLQDTCICQVKCVSDSINTECPVCSIDYTVCMQETAAKLPVTENIPVNDAKAAQEEKIVLAADENIPDWERFDFECGGIKYRILNDTQAEVGGQCEQAAGGIIIPKTTTDPDKGHTYQVTAIGSEAFKGCTALSSVEIPDSVTAIGSGAFTDCGALSNIEIPDSVTAIGSGAFAGCGALSNIEIPDSVTAIGSGAFTFCNSLSDIKIPNSVTSIGSNAFQNCSSLSNVEIPNSVTSLESYTFSDCDNLSCIKIWDTIHLKQAAFANCAKFNTLQIVVSSDPVTSPIVDRGSAFESIPNDRSIVFLSKDGTKLTKDAWTTARTAYLTSKSPYDFSGKDLWWGWKIEDQTATVPTYKVTVDVNKDDTPWPDHDRSFALTKDNGVSFVTNLDAVEAGTYTLYDVTDGTRKLDTGVEVPITDTDVTTAPVNYYTVTFYDDTVPYGSDTAQAPQIVLKTAGRVICPVANPAKTDYSFKEWVTDDKITPFDFERTEITAPASIYATWTQNLTPVYVVTIHVKKDGLDWPDHGRTFALLSDTGTSFITDLTQVANGVYNIYDITGINPSSYWSKAIDTGKDVRVNGTDTDVDVTVQNGNAEAAIHYYTVTFFDKDTDYKADTPQRPQIVLSNKHAVEPAPPVKADQRFAGWKTQKDGGIPFPFGDPVTGTTSVFASWTSAPVSGPFYITATAQAGGTISPSGIIGANKGDSQTFTIAADTGFHIKSVNVDGKDVTAFVIEANGIYTFTNINADHTITVVFEADDNTPGNNNTPDGGNKPGSNNTPDGGNKPDSNNTPDGGNNSGGGNTTLENGKTNHTAENNGNPYDGSDNTLVQESSNTGGEYAPVNGNIPASVSPAPDKSNAPDIKPAASSNTAQSREPKTGDPSPVEIYATIAMIAGLAYLLLYFMDEERGMTEREKDVFVAAFIRWAKKGGKFRKFCALAAIFCLLVYYHSIGKHSCRGRLDEGCLKQALN